MPNPFPYSDTNKRYHTYDYAMRKRFGGKCIKIPLDGGFTCPNIDGTKGRGGCSYCTKQGLPLRGRPLAEQYRFGIERLMPKWGDSMETPRLIPYFQTFSGTYAPIEQLERLYEEAMALPHAVAMAIATRADCITPEVAELLHRVAERIPLTVELGLQTVHETTARRIGRGHSYEEFQRGFTLLEGIERCVHLIDGLLGEDEEMMLRSAAVVNELGAEQVKIHFLYIAEGTAMAEAYRRGDVTALSRDRYVSILIRQLELLEPEVIIGRVSGDGQGEELIAPLWSRRKRELLNQIDKTMANQNSWQGKMCKVHKNRLEISPS